MMSRVSKYTAIASATFQQQLAYRSVFLMQLASQLMVLLSVYYVWRALFAGRLSLGGFAWSEMQAYLLLSFVVNAVIGLHSELFMTWRILDGSIAMDLLKPVDYQLARFVETITTTVIEGTLAIALASLVGLVIGIHVLPAEAWSVGAGLVSFVLAILIKFGVVYFTGLLCFWTTNGWGISWAQTAVSQLFSGALVPLPFLPGFLRTLAEWLPFHGMTYAPVSIFMGRVTGEAAMRMLLQQVFWALALWFIARLAWRYMVKKVTIHGG